MRSLVHFGRRRKLRKLRTDCGERGNKQAGWAGRNILRQGRTGNYFEKEVLGLTT